MELAGSRHIAVYGKLARLGTHTDYVRTCDPSHSFSPFCLLHSTMQPTIGYASTSGTEGP